MNLPQENMETKIEPETTTGTRLKAQQTNNGQELKTTCADGRIEPCFDSGLWAKSSQTTQPDEAPPMMMPVLSPEEPPPAGTQYVNGGRDINGKPVAGSNPLKCTDIHGNVFWCMDSDAWSSQKNATPTRREPPKKARGLSLTMN